MKEENPCLSSSRSLCAIHGGGCRFNRDKCACVTGSAAPPPSSRFSHFLTSLCNPHSHTHTLTHSFFAALAKQGCRPNDYGMSHCTPSLWLDPHPDEQGDRGGFSWPANPYNALSPWQLHQYNRTRVLQRGQKRKQPQSNAQETAEAEKVGPVTRARIRKWKAPKPPGMTELESKAGSFSSKENPSYNEMKKYAERVLQGSALYTAKVPLFSEEPTDEEWAGD